MRILPKFKLEKIEEDYKGSYTYCAVPTEPDKFPWLRDKYFLELGYPDRLESAKKRFAEFTTKWTRGFVNPQEYIDIWAKVDADKVNSLISEMLGLTEEFNPKFEKVLTFDDYYKVDKFELNSNVNLALASPIVGSAWRKFYISTWSTWGKINEKTGKISISLTLNFGYEHHGGGSNGAKCCTIDIYDDRLDIKNHKGIITYKFDDAKS